MDNSEVLRTSCGHAEKVTYHYKISQFIAHVHVLTVGEGRARSAAKSAVLCPTKSGPVSGIARGPV